MIKRPNQKAILISEMSYEERKEFVDAIQEELNILFETHRDEPFLTEKEKELNRKMLAIMNEMAREELKRR